MSSASNQTKYIPFQDNTKPIDDNTSPTIGGVLTCSRIAWLASGSHLRVLNVDSGRRIGSWHFGHTTRDLTTRVLCVIELPDLIVNARRPALLAVGLSTGLVCIYEATTSRVLKAINVNLPVNSLVDVGVNGALNAPGRLTEAFDGVLGVGLDGGDVLLVDLCRQSFNGALSIYNNSPLHDEERPCEVRILQRGDLGRLNRLKERSANTGRHLAYHLNYHPAMEERTTDPNSAAGHGGVSHFPLQSCSGDVLLFAPRSQCGVSALFDAPALCAVVVGYSFGCWQMWSLLGDMAVLYTSLLHRERVPVAYFALQEPSDDPRTCCYLWAVHSYPDIDRTRTLPHAVMHSLSYERKEWHDGYGYLYERLSSCTIRFQMDLTCDDSSSTGSADVALGHCLAVRSSSLSGGRGRTTVTNFGLVDPHHHGSDDTLELCAISYTATRTTQHSRTYVVLFDLNQWYLSQMPSEARAPHANTYMTRMCVSDHMVDKESLLLDVRLDVKTLQPFRQRLRRLEEHFRPDSLSYSCMALSGRSANQLHHMGVQAHLLHQLCTLGSLALLKPGELYKQALICGLVYSNTNLTLTTTPTTTLQQQREALLDIALEQPPMNYVLERCASEWADGSSLAVGCALHGWLLEWAWQRAQQLKGDVDLLCIPLFDFDCSKLLVGLDNQAKVQLDAFCAQLGRLRRLFEHVRGMGGDGEGGNEGWVVQRRTETMGAVCRWLAALRWLLVHALLPEAEEDTYPADSITRIIQSRRAELERAQQSLGDNLPTPRLYIDTLIDTELGGHTTIGKLWAQSEYPPPSLQAALRTYLIQAECSDLSNESLLIQQQHMLFTYLMLDIGAQCERQFPTVTFNNLSEQQCKLVEVMWQLDHGHFAQAMEELVNPCVTAHVPHWQHRCIVVQLLAQGQHRFALLYVQLRRPPRMGNTVLLDVQKKDMEDWLMCTLFVRNGRLYDALKCCRDTLHRRKLVEMEHDDLLEHIWSECARSGQLNNTLITSIHGLSANEEQSLFRYMDGVQFPHRHIMRAIYCLQRHKSDNVAAIRQGLTSNDKMLNNIMDKMTTSTSVTDDNDVKVDGTLPMSVLIHNNNFTSSKNKSMLWKVRDTCVATVSAILRQQEQQQPQIRGHKRKQSLSNRFHDVPPLQTPRFYRENLGPQDEEYSSPRKRIKHLSTTDNNKINTSYQMETPLAKRSGQQQRKTPSIVDPLKLGGSVLMETPQSILKKRIKSASSEEERFNRSTPELEGTIGPSDQGSTGPKRIGRSQDAAASSIVGVRFDSSMMSSTTDDSAQQQTTATTSTTTFYSPDNSDSISGQISNTCAANLADNDNIAQEVADVSRRAQSPMRRKPIRDTSEAVRSSPRLQQQQRNLTETTIETIQSELTPLKVVEALEETSNPETFPALRIERKDDRQLNKTITSTLYSMDGIAQIQQESTKETTTITSKEIVEIVETAVVVVVVVEEITEGDLNSTEAAQLPEEQEINKDIEEEYCDSDIYKDLEDSQQQTIGFNQGCLLDLEDDEPMDVDDEEEHTNHNESIVEISNSSNDDSSDNSTTSVEEEEKVHSSSSICEDSEEASTRDTSDRSSLRNTAFIQEESQKSSLIISLQSTSSDENGSNTQSDLEILSFDQKKHSEEEEDSDDSEINNTIPIIEESAEIDEENNLNLNIYDVDESDALEDKSDNLNGDSNSEILIYETLKNLEESSENENKLTTSSNSLDTITDVDILQISLPDNLLVAPQVMEEDVLNMSFPEPDLPQNIQEENELAATQYVDKNTDIDRSLKDAIIETIIDESVLLEEVQVDPDILTVILIEDASTKSEIKKKHEEITAIRRSARLRRDSVASSSNSSSTAFSTTKANKKTRRSMSVEVNTEPSMSSSVAKPAPRSNRRTRSVDAETELSHKRDKQSQTAQWLTTIMEEQDIEADHQRWTRSAVAAVEAVARNVILTEMPTGVAVGRRQRRSASVDSPVTIVERPKRAARKTTTPVDSNTSPINTRTRSRTNSTSSTQSDNVIPTSRRPPMVEQRKNNKTEDCARTPKRSRSNSNQI